MNDQHRYLLQKFFNNEGTYSITTVGTQNLSLTGSLLSGATTATLNSSWNYYTTTVSVTFSNSDVRQVRFQKGSTAISWDAPLTATATSSISFGGIQYYPLPPKYSKLKDLTITVGNLKWTPKEIFTREEWDNLNVFPYNADIPAYYYLYPGGDHSGMVGIWPIPSTTGNVITFNYKYRVPDLSLADYTTPGTLSVSSGATSVTGTTTTLTVSPNKQLEARWVQFSPTSSSSTTGDNLWYQIYSVDSATGFTLYQPYQGTSITNTSSYTIGQMPLLHEDFHDMLVYGALVTYFSSIVDNPNKANEFQALYDRKLKLLEEYAGRKTINVNLRTPGIGLNPNLFPSNIGS